MPSAAEVHSISPPAPLGLKDIRPRLDGPTSLPIPFDQLTQFLSKVTQQNLRLCGVGSGVTACAVENTHIIELVVVLSVSLFLVLCMYQHIRDDKEDQLTPLCPQLLVKKNALQFKFDLDPSLDEVKVTTLEDKLLCKVETCWPDLRRPGFGGVAATLRLQDPYGQTLCTVVLRSVAVRGQGICICRAGCEIFGFMEPVHDNRYVVQHRSKTVLLVMNGNLASAPGEVEVLSSTGAEVCTMRRVGSGPGAVCVGRCAQNTDAGLVICSAIASSLHRRLLADVPVTCWDLGAADPHGGGRHLTVDPFLPNAVPPVPRGDRTEEGAPLQNHTSHSNEGATGDSDAPRPASLDDDAVNKSERPAEDISGQETADDRPLAIQKTQTAAEDEPLVAQNVPPAANTSVVAAQQVPLAAEDRTPAVHKTPPAVEEGPSAHKMPPTVQVTGKEEKTGVPALPEDAQGKGETP